VKGFRWSGVEVEGSVGSVAELRYITISDLGAEGDVLLGGTRSFLWRHGGFTVCCMIRISTQEISWLWSEFLRK
jgi:hypothetical protein